MSITRNRKMIWAAGMILALLLGLLAPAAVVRASSVQHRRVRVGYVDRPRFSEGRSENDTKTGYGYEYLQKLAAYTGWEYDYVYGEWADILDQLRRGEVDILTGVSYSDERAEDIDYPDEPMGRENYYIYARSDQPFVQDGGASIAGAIIGCNRDSFQEMYLRQWNENNGGNCRIVTFPGNEELYAALDSNAIHAVVDTDRAIFADDELYPLIKVGESEYYAAVSQSAPEVLAEMNQALREMNFSEPYLTEYLHNKYFTGTGIRPSMQVDEQEWLQQHGTIRIAYEKHFLSFCGYDRQTGEMVGALKVFMDAAEGVYGAKMEAVAYDTVADSMEALRRGEVDVVFPVYESLSAAEDEDLFISDRLAGTAMTAIIGDHKRFDESAVNVVAVTRGFQDILWYLGEYYPQWRVLELETVPDCLRAVRDGAADCMVESTYVYKNLIGDRQVETVSLSRGADLCFAVRRNDTMLLNVIDYMVHLAPEAEILAALTQYSNRQTSSLGDFMRRNMFMVFGVGGLILFTFFLLVIRATRAEGQTRELNRKLIEKQTELEKALEDSRAAAAAKTAFLSRMSHDIRTPLNGIIGLIEIDDRHADDRQLVDENRAKAKVAANHLLSLISDVLDLTKMDDDSVQLAREPFNVLELAKDVMTITQMRAGEAGVTILHEDASGKVARPYVFGSPLHVRQIFLNIFGNAIKYNRPNGSITWDADTVAVNETTVTYRITITDTGIGMSPEFLEHLFEPFTQEHTDARSVYQGTGLGMAIVKSLVDKMHGTIEVTSEVDRGSTFVVTLPFEIASEEDLPREDGAEVSDLEGMKILLVEDNELNMEIAEAILEDLGAVITEAHDGREALEIFDGNPAGTFDVILMDLMMPVMDGYAATRAIRALPREDGAQIPIVAMTANAFTEDAARCLEAGMNAHLTKPIDVPRLLNTLGALR